MTPKAARRLLLITRAIRFSFRLLGAVFFGTDWRNIRNMWNSGATMPRPGYAVDVLQGYIIVSIVGSIVSLCGMVAYYTRSVDYSESTLWDFCRWGLAVALVAPAIRLLYLVFKCIFMGIFWASKATASAHKELERIAALPDSPPAGAGALSDPDSRPGAISYPEHQYLGEL